MEDGTTAALRRLPAVGALLNAPQIAPLIEQHGRTLVVEAVRRAIDEARNRILSGDSADVSADDVARVARALEAPSLKRVINGTGVLLHTNLGRAPLARAAERAVSEIARGYSNLELDLESGERGSRHVHTASHLAAVLQAESAIALNNCAGAVLLMLAALCRGREVIVSRGELVEIGGGFRVPDVMAESGAKLIEVGTTNKVHLRDYEAAINAGTAAILWVHRSNFALVGFTAQPSFSELARLASSRGVLLLADVGSGLVASDEELGPSAPVIREEPRARDLLAQGADLVALSGDKLLGGPQAGILAGKAALVEKSRKHPLARALRADKLTIAALEATLALYRAGRAKEVPLIRWLSEDPAAITERAEALRSSIAHLAPDLELTLASEDALVGGGSLPLARLPTAVLLVGPPGAYARNLSATLRQQDPPVITRMIADRTAIDLRTVSEEEIATLAASVVRANGTVNKLRVKQV